MKPTTIGSQILHLQFPSRKAMGRTLMRYEETYESPEFRGRAFCREEFRNWYRAQYGSFTYFTDWDGFNIPDHVFRRFLAGDFDPLTAEEKRVLRAVKAHNASRYYVIATHRATHRSTLKHELAHALYYLYPGYRLRVGLAVLGLGLSLFNVFRFLRRNRYGATVYLDEAHAYVLDGTRAAELGVPARRLGRVRCRLQRLYTTYLKKAKSE
jgi:hypothetical protein